MKEFFFKSVFFVTIFSIVRFFLNLTLASLLLPSDYGVILLPLIIFSFFDLLLEGGLHSGIIKFNASKDDLITIVKRKSKIGILAGPLIAILIILSDYFTELNIPLLVVLGFLANSLIKITNYFAEAKLIAEGKYIEIEFIQFFISAFLYITFIVIIPYAEIPGYYFLVMFNILLVTIYGILLNIYLRPFINLRTQSSLNELQIFSASVIQSNFIFSIGSRIDEISAAALINSTILGLYSKTKEIGIMIGTFSSKIISRPWYYVACKIKPRAVKQIYFFGLIFCIFALIALLKFLLAVVSFFISILGPNWTLLSDFNIFIVLIMAMYFFVQFTNSTMLALGLEKELLVIDRWIIGIKIALYLVMLGIITFNNLEFDIKIFLFLEVFIRLVNLLSQIICLIIKTKLKKPINTTNI